MNWRAVFFCAITAVVAVTMQGTYAQTRFGVHAGVNRSSVSVPGSDEGYTARVGLVLGGRMEFGILRNLYFYLAPQYVEKGYRVDYRYQPETAGEETMELPYLQTYEYFEIPAGLKYRFLDGSIHPFLFGGLTIAFNTKAAVYWRRGGGGHSVDDYRYTTERVQFLAHGGVGVEYALSPSAALVLESGYSASATSMEIYQESYGRNVNMTGGILLTLE